MTHSPPGSDRVRTEFPREHQHVAQRAQDGFVLLAQTAGALLASREPQRVVDELCKKVAVHLGCDVFFNFLADAASGRLRLNACGGIASDDAARLEWLDYGVAVCGCVARDHQRIIAENILEVDDPRTALVKGFGVQAYCCHPLMAGDRLLGTLSFGTKQRSRFTPEEIEFMRAVADQVALAMERIASEDALRVSEERFRRLVEVSSQIVWVTNAQGQPVEDSPSWRAFTGRSYADWVGWNWLNVIHPDDREKVNAAWQKAVQTVGPYRVEFRQLHRSGEYRDMECQAAPLLNADGSVREWVGMNVDITERKRAEAALRQSEESFRALADSIPNLAWWANADGYITWYNRRWYEYTGTTWEQMQGWGWQSVHDPDLLPEVMEKWRASIATSQPFEMEFPLRGADGRFRWFLTRIVPVRDASDAVVRWFGTNTDISELREARMILKRSHAELEKLVAERTAKLQELVAELEHFSYTITHDMRAPLRAMRGFGQAAVELCAEGPDGPQRMFLGRIMTAAERMDALITDALSYSKAVRSDLPLDVVDIAKLLRGMLDTYPEFQHADGTIHIDAELPAVIGNEAGLTQCFSNLLGNALKFVDPARPARVVVRAERIPTPTSPEPAYRLAAPVTPMRHPAWVRIWVEDNGTGIPATMLPRIFQMFTRGSNDQAGTGIGLALVRKVVERMGGQVGVESELGKGSRFWIELPEPEPGNRAPESLGRQAQFPGVRIFGV